MNLNITKSDVINDPLGQIHSPAVVIVIFISNLILFRNLKIGNVQTNGK